MVARSRQLWVPKFRRRRARVEDHGRFSDVDSKDRDAHEVEKIGQVRHPLTLCSVLYP